VKARWRWWVVRRLLGVAAVPDAWEAMPEPELRAALAVDEWDPRFRAIMQVIREMEAQAAAQVGNAGTLHHGNAALVLAHAAGGMEWLREARAYAQALREESFDARGDGQMEMRMEGTRRRPAGAGADVA